MNRLDFFGTFGIKEKSTKIIYSYTHKVND